MKNNDNLLTDFIALLEISLKERTEKSLKERTEKLQAEKDTTEKKCNCTGNNCKKQQDFNELIGRIEKFRVYLTEKTQTLGEVDTFLCSIEKELLSAGE